MLKTKNEAQALLAWWRLKQGRGHQGSVASLARALGVKDQTVYGWARYGVIPKRYEAQLAQLGFTCKNEKDC